MGDVSLRLGNLGWYNSLLEKGTGEIHQKKISKRRE